MVMMMMSFNCSCMDSLCKANGIRYLRLVESMCYSQRALVFALLLSLLQPAISQRICSPGTAGAPGVVKLTCGGDCLEGCTPLLSASSGIISDGPSYYPNEARCWWLLVNSSIAEIQISFSELQTDSSDIVGIYQCYSASCSPRTELKSLSGDLLVADKSKIYTSTTGFLQVTFTSDESGILSGFTAAWSAWSECTDCTAGKFSSVGASTCLDCTAGKFSDSVGASTCSYCAAGKFSAVAGASVADTCANCDLGKYSEAGADVCAGCASGKYSDNAGASFCTSCAAGTYSYSVGASAASTCSECAAGKFSAVAGARVADTCTSCDAGKFSAVAGASTCSECAAGKFSGNAASACASCTPGTAGVKAVASLTCSTTSGTCASDCTPIESPGATLGTISDRPGNYANDGACWWLLTTTSPDTTIQISFPSFSTRTGDFVYLYRCIDAENCPPTSMFLKKDVSLDSSGVYTSNTGFLKMWFSSDPYGTGEGFTSAWSVAATCTRCTAGKFSDSVGASTCSACAAGKFSGTGASTCTSCDGGMFWEASFAKCSRCPSGTYSAAGVSTCTSCAAGTYADGANVALTCYGSCSQDCTETPSASSGTISDGDGDYSNMERCWWLLATSPGVEIRISFSEFHTELGSDFVKILVCRDKWCDDQTEILQVSGGISPESIYSSNTGFLQVTFSSDEAYTSTGFIGNWWVSGNVQCTNCPAGSYSAAKGATEALACASCAAGTYSAAGASACASCAAGKFSSAVGAMMMMSFICSCRNKNRSRAPYIP
jgi:hypothetical protein